jgi:hypothetical protein
MEIDPEQLEFEAFAENEGMDIEIHPNGGYVSQRTRFGWESWSYRASYKQVEGVPVSWESKSDDSVLWFKIPVEELEYYKNKKEYQVRVLFDCPQTLSHDVREVLSYAYKVLDSLGMCKGSREFVMKEIKRILNEQDNK